jgi:hypothetical protein
MEQADQYLLFHPFQISGVRMPENLRCGKKVQLFNTWGIFYKGKRELI